MTTAAEIILALAKRPRAWDELQVACHSLSQVEIRCAVEELQAIGHGVRIAGDLVMLEKRIIVAEPIGITRDRYRPLFYGSDGRLQANTWSGGFGLGSLDRSLDSRPIPPEDEPVAVATSGPQTAGVSVWQGEDAPTAIHSTSSPAR
jgi:hypothetical protein